MMMLTKMIKMMMMISHPLPESHTAGCRSRGEDLCCLSRSVPAKPTSPQGLDFLEIVVSISYIVFDITKCTLTFEKKIKDSVPKHFPSSPHHYIV